LWEIVQALSKLHEVAGQMEESVEDWEMVQWLVVRMVMLSALAVERMSAQLLQNMMQIAPHLLHSQPTSSISG
jgi:hypothetical protein